MLIATYRFYPAILLNSSLDMVTFLDELVTSDITICQVKVYTA
jgi:hypothetical protein